MNDEQMKAMAEALLKGAVHCEHCVQLVNWRNECDCGMAAIVRAAEGVLDRMEGNG